jgi:hypothetical protein
MRPEAPIRLKLEPGFPLQSEMKVRVSPDEADALIALIEAEGLRCGPLMEHSLADPNSTVAYLVYGIPAGAAAAAAAIERLAKALSTWSHRHDGKSIELHANGTAKIILTGFSTDEVRMTLDEIAERQRVIDQDWQQAGGRHQPPKTEPEP